MKLQSDKIVRQIRSLVGTKTFVQMAEVAGNQDNLNVQHIITDSKPLILKLKKEFGANFYVNQKNEMIIDCNGIKLFFECEEDLYIINEVFNDLTYEFQIHNSAVLIDVGMHIGTSTLFFLNKPNILKVYGFEPVKATFQKLVKNLELNNCNDKVVAMNFGLGKNDRNETFEFTNEFKGSIGIVGLNEYKQKHSKSIEKVQVEIKDASDQISSIMDENPGADIFLKLDCEGGEYEILPRLVETDLLKKIRYIVMEWHGVDFFNHMEVFDGFSVFYHKISPETGMLYAVRVD